MNPKMRSLIVFIAALSLIILTACSPANSTANQDQNEGINGDKGNISNPKNNPENVDPPTPDDDPEEISPDDSVWVADAPLSEGGPWYVVSNREGTYAFNMDGTGLTLLTRETPGSYTLNRKGVASSGGRFAYLTTVDGYDAAKLHIVDIPNSLEHTVIDLYSFGDVELDARRAIVEQPSYSWSHSGDQMAFFGVIDGPSSDLYVYNTTDRIITRLTSGPSQGYQPSWSPDDQYIVHAGAETFGTGAGYSMVGVWAAAADDSGVLNLPMPGNSADEVILGWRNNDTFLSFTWSPMNGPHNLRFTNLHVALAEEVLEQPFIDAVFGDEAHPRILVRIYGSSNEENQIFGPGIYTLDPPSYQPELLLESGAGILHEMDVGAFLIEADGEKYLLATNEFINISDWEGNLIFSEYGTPAGYSSDGLWVHIAGENEMIFDSPVQVAAWGSEGDSILFSTNDDLWVAVAPEWEPILVGAAFFTENIVLVMP